MTGEQLRDQGISRALQSTEWGWQNEAYRLLKQFVKTSDPFRVFLVEDVRAFAKDQGLPDPPSNRAWGGIVVKAKKEGVVKQVGYSQVKNPTAHKANAALWQSALS